MELIEIANNLDKNPLHYFSLNNTELFHSNFWYWLSTIDKIKTVNLFCENLKDITFDNDEPFQREKDNIDFTIITAKKIIIIENKIKSVTTEQQLIKYYEKIIRKYKDKNLDFVLVTPFKNDNIIKKVNDSITKDHGETYLWRNLTYMELYENLKSFKSDNNFYSQIIESYRKLLFELTNFFEVIDNDGFDYNFVSNNIDKKDIFNALKKIKMFDIYKKYKNSRIAFRLFKDLEMEFKKRNINVTFYKNVEPKEYRKKNNGSINIKYDYRNLCPIIGATIIFDDFGLGIQIQDKEYRYFFLQWKPATKNAKKLLDKKIWITNGQYGEGRKGLGMNQYNSKDYGDNFFYKYNIITTDETNYEVFKNKLFKDLTVAIEVDAKKIKKIIEKG